MNIKSLLLGSAAALVAVSGARAADAPVTMVEPEPVDYVRICDVYGTGFFYIPGTETCLKVSGSVRFRVGVADDSDDRANSLQVVPVRGLTNVNGRVVPTGTAVPALAGSTDVFAGFQSTVRVNFDAREETELGTLRGYIGLEADYGYAAGPNFTGVNNDSPLINAGLSSGIGPQFQTSSLRNGTVSDSTLLVKEGFIQLGGLTMGLTDSLWAGGDGGISDGLLTDTDWSAGDFRQNRISYTAAFFGFSGSVSVEDDGDGDITPDVIAKLAYTSGFGGAYVMGVYDEDARDSFVSRNGLFTGVNNLGLAVLNNAFGSFALGTSEFGSANDGSDGAFVVKAGVKLQDLLFAGSILKVEGHYAFDPSVYAIVGAASLGTFNNLNTGGTGLIANVFNNSLPSKYQIGAGYQQTFGRFLAGVSGVYGETFDLNATFTQLVPNVLGGFTAGATSFPFEAGEASYYGIAGNVGYEITKNFKTLLSVDYRDVDAPAGVTDLDRTTGFLEFKRFF